MRLMVIGIAVLAVAIVVACWWAVGTTQYQATAVIMIDRPEDARSVSRAWLDDLFDNEVTTIRRIAPPLLAGGQTFKVMPIPKTHLVEIAVVGPDPAATALRCNLIVDAYKSSAEDRPSTLRVQVVSMAYVPRTPYRSWRQLLPWHWGH